jgi:hypothetical protein
MAQSALFTSAYVSIRQHTSAYGSIRQHTSAYGSIRQHLLAQPAPVGVGAVTDNEIVAAIRFARAKEASGEKHRKKGEATLNDLIMWIRWQRKEERENRRGHDLDTTAGSMDHQKNRMLRAKSWEERWEILCESHYLMCEPLDAWATEYWGNDWVDQRNKRRKEVAACVREVIAAMSHGRAA